MRRRVRRTGPPFEERSSSYWSSRSHYSPSLSRRGRNESRAAEFNRVSRVGMRKTSLLAIFCVAGFLCGLEAAKKDAAFSRRLPPSDRIRHALNRLTFGPRPGDAEEVRREGLKRW